MTFVWAVLGGRGWWDLAMLLRGSGDWKREGKDKAGG
jgi:hypothetical protein